MPVPIAEQDPTDPQRRDDGEQRVTSTRQSSRHRTAAQRTSTPVASASASSTSATLFADYSSRVQQLQNEVNKVVDKEPPGSADTSQLTNSQHCHKGTVTDMR